LDSEQADFGGHPGAPGDPFAGASAGCAAVTAALAALALRQGDLRIPELLPIYRGSAGVKILVLGCGPAGVVTALGLRALGYDVSVIGEVRPYPVTEGISATRHWQTVN
jgi:hypothetical protein